MDPLTDPFYPLPPIMSGSTKGYPAKLICSNVVTIVLRPFP